MRQRTKKQCVTRHRSGQVILVAIWNVHSLVESSGDKRTCRKHPSGSNAGPRTIDCKLDLLIGELRRYKTSADGMQETKWFGGDVWSEGGFTLLQSGQQLPSDNEQVERNEGVGIVLDEAAAVWKEAGEIWEAVSSRIVTARIKLRSVERRLPGGSREKTNTFMTIVCSYAPTAKTPHRLK